MLETPIGTIGVEATAAGLRRVRLPAHGTAPEAHGNGRAAANAAAAAGQLEEYLRGDRERFEISLDWGGVEVGSSARSGDAVRDRALRITVTYGELGRLACVDDPRDVGVMMARNPIPLVVPCHRVVASDGLGGYGGGLELKRDCSSSRVCFRRVSISVCK